MLRGNVLKKKTIKKVKTSLPIGTTKLSKLMIGYSASREAICVATGISTITLWKYETRRAIPMRKKAEAISKFFDIPVEEIFDTVYGE